MFAKENIIILTDNLIDEKFNKSGFQKYIDDLYDLVVEIVNELNITSLSKITIKEPNLFEKEAGMVLFSFNGNIPVSEVELSRKTFAQFNNSQNSDLKNEALATIYHELYHVYDKENLFNLFGNVKIKKKELPYYQIGVKYWSEFFAYYKTKELHISDYSIIQFDSVYSKMRQNKPSQNEVEDFFYIVSNISAYMKNQQYVRELENDTDFKYFKKDVSYDALVKKLNTIMQIYPENVNNVEDFISLGKMYCKLLEHFWYKIKFSSNNNMIIEKYLPSLSPIKI